MSSDLPPGIRLQLSRKEAAAAAGNSISSANGQSDDEGRIKNDESKVLDDSNDFEDMKSLLPSSSNSGSIPAQTKSKIESLDIDGGSDDDDAGNTTKLRNDCCCGLIRDTRSVGNMRILFPEYFDSSGWGVVGPNPTGPLIVWLILVAATHGVINGIVKHNLGIISAVISYLFLAVSTYRLTDVCLRDPGICFDQEIPEHESPERRREYRFCDRCRIWQPPDGVHCPNCNVCVAGYDHYCVWMGTCIGKRNYRQFVKFNLTVSPMQCLEIALCLG